MDRTEALARRIRAQQLGRAPSDSRPVTDAAVLDLGVQDTWRDGASWALANRGVPVSGPEVPAGSPDLALVWSLRGAPHYYRRSDLRGVLDAVSPFDDADARKRTLDASKQLTAVGVGMLECLGVVASTMRAVVTGPTPKGEMSGALTERLPAEYLRWCNPCQATHVYEQSFRFGALYAGLELTPGTSPPVLRRIKGWRRPPGPGDPTKAPPELRVIEGYLRLCGPASQRDVARFLESPLAVVKAHWPDAAVETEVDGAKVWTVDESADVTVDPQLVRLLGPFDLFLQARDRDLVVPDKARHKSLWPTIGRPGAILVGTELVGTWRPKAAGAKLSLTLDLWQRVSPAVRRLIDDEAERLAAHRGVTLTGVMTT